MHDILDYKGYRLEPVIEPLPEGGFLVKVHITPLAEGSPTEAHMFFEPFGGPKEDAVKAALVLGMEVVDEDRRDED